MTLLLSGCMYNSYPQDLNYKFFQYNQKDGLVNNTVQAISQDRMGYIWLGTLSGLSRYDGTNFNNYINESSDSTSLSNNAIWDILEDKKGNLWVATEYGLNLFNREQDNFNQFFHHENDSTSLGNSLIKDILETRDGKIIVATFSPILSVYRPETNNFENITITVVNNQLIYGLINSITEDRFGNIWAGTEGHGVFRYNPITKTSDHFTNSTTISNSLSHNAVRTVLSDRQGNVWIGTAGGLNRFIDDANGFESYVHNPLNKNSISEGNVDAIFEDSKGNLWLGIDGGGLVLFDYSEKTFNHFRYDSQSGTSISSDVIRRIFEDRSENLWIGTFASGVNMHNKLANPFHSFAHNLLDPQSLSHSSAMCFLEDSKGKLWVGTDGGGLNLLDKASNTFTHYKSTGKPGSISSNAVLCLYEDRQGQLWAGTFGGGLNKFNRQSNTFSVYQTDYLSDSTLSNARVWAIFEDSRGNFWLGTLGGGLNLLNRNTGKFTHYMPVTGDKTSISSFLVWAIFEDSKGNLWIGTQDGLNLFNYETKTFRSYKFNPEDSTSLSNNLVSCIIEGRNKQLWVSTIGGGLNSFDPVTGTFHAITTKDGLSGNNIFGILEDYHGNLWLSTNNGITRFNPFTGETKRFDENYGLMNSQYNIGSYYKDRKGIMYFGGVNGFNFFNPSEVRINTTPPSLVLTELKVLNQPVKPGAEPERIKQHISVAKEINLSYKDYFFNISFTSLTFFAAKNVSYYYKLEGFDLDWVYAGQKQNVTYTNLDPGKYTFRVKAQNDAGVWSLQDLQIRINISPPVWKTRWFISLEVLLIILLIFGIMAYRERSLKVANRELEQKVQERTATIKNQYDKISFQKDEIEKNNKELELHRNNLEALVKERTIDLEREKQRAEESDKLKSAFLDNMSHEIRTPMNAIIGYLDFIHDPEFTQTEKEGFLDTIRKSAQLLLRIIEDIMTMAKIHSGQLDIFPKELELNTLIKSIASDFRDELKSEEKPVHFKLVLPKKNHKVSLDDRRIRQVLNHILGNALKYSEKGSIELIIQVNDQNLSFEVSDTGLGIPKQHIEKIFNRFYKVEEGLKQFRSGIGIGLSISKAIIEMMGGEIAIESEIGCYTKVVFTIPMLISPVKGMHIFPGINSFQTSEKPELIPLWTNRKILIVEDDDLNFRYIQFALKPTKIKIVRAASGKEAIELISNNEFSLVFMDLKLPDGSGIEATKWTKERYPDLPVIAQTAYPDLLLKEPAEYGFDYLLAKPFKREAIINLLKKYFSEPQ